MLYVKYKSHVQRVAAIDCTDVEHAPIRARIIHVSLGLADNLRFHRNKEQNSLKLISYLSLNMPIIFLIANEINER
jgi:hypothetical protein